MKLGEAFFSLAKSAGVPEDNEELKALVATEAAKVEISDDVMTAINKGLFTRQSAMNDPEIIKTLKTSFKAETLNPLDEKFKLWAKELIGEDFLPALNEAKGTYARADLFKEKLVEAYKAKLEAAASESSDPVETEKLNADITKLNGELAQLKEGTVPKQEFEDAKAAYEKQIDNYHIGSLFLDYKWGNELDASVNQATARTLFDHALVEKNIKLIRDESGLKLQTQEGSEYFSDDNKSVTPKEFADKLVADKGLVLVSTPADPNKPIIPPKVIEGGKEDSAALTELAAFVEVQGRTLAGETEHLIQ